jgi:hypothetical protein
MHEETPMPSALATPIEQSLRAMLAAEAETFQENELAPLEPLPGRPRAPRTAASRRGWALAAVTGAAATTAGLLAGAQLLATTPAQNGPAATATIVSAAPQTPVKITFTASTSRLDHPAAKVTVPVPHVQATNPQVAGRISQVIVQQIADSRTGFRNSINDPGYAALKPSGTTAEQQITATTIAWKRFLTVRLDDVEVNSFIADDGTPRTSKAHNALIFDTTTGARLLPPDLFADLDRASAMVRAVLVADHRNHATADQLARLSLRPSEAGTTTPLTCYPAPEGLHCAVDDGALTPDYTGPLESIIDWRSVDPLLKPGLRS